MAAAMEDQDIEPDLCSLLSSDDFCDSVLSRFSSSAREDHQQVCTIIRIIWQELKEQNIPLKPVAYFGAICSSLDRLSCLASDPPLDKIEALMTALYLVFPRVSNAVLNNTRESVSKIVTRPLTLDGVTVGTLVSAMKCIARLLSVRDGVSWADASQLYDLLLGFMTDSHPKVRRQAGSCIREVLESFQDTASLVSASEGITKALEKFLLLAGGSNTDHAEGPKGAQDVLYCLYVLKECLPLLSTSCINTILKYYMKLLELQQPMVTRHVTDSLNALCLCPTVVVSADALLLILSALALSTSSNEISSDNIPFTARLLGAGMKKVYSLNRQICVLKLPIVFTALKDVMASNHEEAIFATTDVWIGLISNCIDEDLIKQGVDEIEKRKFDGSGGSCPTIIEKLCAIIKSTLDYHYNSVWHLVFQVVSAMFDSLGNYSSDLMREILENLEDIQGLLDDDFPYRKQLHECIGSAIGAMGPETFLSFLPLNFDPDNLSRINAWLFPILKQHTVGARLSFYTKTILPMISVIKQKSRELEAEGLIVSARSSDALTYSLWSLLPSFCDYPSDTAESFDGLKDALCGALAEQSNVRKLISSALHLLILQNKRVVEEKDDFYDANVSAARHKAMAHYTLQVASCNLHVLMKSAPDFLTILAKLLVESPHDDDGCFQSIIGDFASVADKKIVSVIFKNTMRELLTVTQNAIKARSSEGASSMRIDVSSNKSSLSIVRARLLDLAVSLFPGLDGEEIGTLFVAVKPALKDVNGLVQKKAYRVLSIIIQKWDLFCSSRLDELQQLMIDILPLCHCSAKRHRLDCLYHLILRVCQLNSEPRSCDVLLSFLTEIILSLKEANKKTRNRAYDVLVQVGRAYRGADNGGQTESSLHQFFNMVAGGVAGETPPMISAAVKGVARLAYEFPELVSTAYKLLPSAFLLLQRKNREIIKAVLGFLKVLIARSKAEALQAYLRCMVDGLLMWQDDTKSHFRAKVKHIIEMLVNKCGIDAVKEVVPEEHAKLLTSIRKLKERKERKWHAATAMEETRSRSSRATTSRFSKWNHTRIFSDFGNSRTENSRLEHGGKSNKSTAAILRSKRLREVEDEGDDPLDLLDQKRMRTVLSSSRCVKRKQESESEPEIDSDGRIIIHEEEEEEERPRREKKPSGLVDRAAAKSEAASRRSSRASTKSKMRGKKSDCGSASHTGREYGSRNAGGDVKKKGKFEPYAYWPIDRKMVSRRSNHRVAARKGMAGVVNMSKKLEGRSASGALLAMKNSKHQKNNRPSQGMTKKRRFN